MQLAVNKKKSSNLHFESIVVTPEMAKSWLEKNKKNRRQTKTTIQKYASDMKSGRWDVTGDPIRFDVNADLIDGQHRLKACILADTPFETVVIYGLPTDVQNVIDSGKGRNASDMFTLSGLHNTAVLAGALRVLISERSGVRPRAHTMSNSAIREAYEKHPHITRYLPMGGQMPRGISGAQVGYLRYVGAELLGKPEKAQAMFEVLRFGAPAYPGDPIHMYRERVIKSGDNKPMAMTRDALWFTLKAAFNMFLAEESVSHLRFGRSNCDIKGLDLSKL